MPHRRILAVTRSRHPLQRPTALGTAPWAVVALQAPDSPPIALVPRALDRHSPATAVAAELVGCGVTADRVAHKRRVADAGQLAEPAASAGHRPRNRAGGECLAAPDPGWRSLACGVVTAAARATAAAVRGWARVDPPLHGSRPA